MTDDTFSKAETVKPNAKDAIKDGLAVRLKAFAEMDNTRVYREKRFAFLAVGAAAVAIAAISLPKTNTETVKPIKSRKPLRQFTSRAMYALGKNLTFILQTTRLSISHLNPMSKKLFL